MFVIPDPGAIVVTAPPAKPVVVSGLPEGVMDMLEDTEAEKKQEKKEQQKQLRHAKQRYKAPAPPHTLGPHLVIVNF